MEIEFAQHHKRHRGKEVHGILKGMCSDVGSSRESESGLNITIRAGVNWALGIPSTSNCFQFAERHAGHPWDIADLFQAAELTCLDITGNPCSFHRNAAGCLPKATAGARGEKRERPAPVGPRATAQGRLLTRVFHRITAGCHLLLPRVSRSRTLQSEGAPQLERRPWEAGGPTVLFPAAAASPAPRRACEGFLTPSSRLSNQQHAFSNAKVAGSPCVCMKYAYTYTKSSRTTI